MRRERREEERPRFPHDKRRHEEELAQQERALEDMHARKGEHRDAERHARLADDHEGRAARAREYESQMEARYRNLATPSKGAITAFKILLPIGLVAAGAVAIAGAFGLLASPGVIPVGVATMALGIGVAVNAIILLGLLLSLRTTDSRVRQLAQLEAARYSQRVREEQNMRSGRREERHDPEKIEVRPQVNLLEYHKVQVRPRRRDGQNETKYEAVEPRQSTTGDGGYRTR